MREVAEQNMKEAHAAYEQLTDFVTKAIGRLDGRDAEVPWPLASRMCKTVPAEIAKKNADSAFALAEKIAKAQNFQEILTLQTQFAQDQMKAFTTQTQELYKLIGGTAQKSGRGWSFRQSDIVSYDSKKEAANPRPAA